MKFLRGTQRTNIVCIDEQVLHSALIQPINILDILYWVNVDDFTFKILAK